MALLDRVTTLIKANLNDLLDKAEEPEKLLKQLLLDLQNQYMQLKTQVAIAIADQHLLAKKQQESATQQKDWLRKAELALVKKDEDLARAAIERSLTYENAARNFMQQVEEQTSSVHILRDALERLEQKIAETKARGELLLAEHRRARLEARTRNSATVEQDQVFDRARRKVSEEEAQALKQHVLEALPTVEERLANLEKSDQVEKVLAELKSRTALLPQ